MPYSEVLLFGAGGLGIETADHFALVPRSPNTCGGEALVACSWPTTLQTECGTQSIPSRRAYVCPPMAAFETTVHFVPVQCSTSVVALVEVDVHPTA